MGKFEAGSQDVLLAGRLSHPFLFGVTSYQGYEYQFDYDDYDACCGECVQTHCALNISGTIQLLKVWPCIFTCTCKGIMSVKVGNK